MYCLVVASVFSNSALSNRSHAATCLSIRKTLARPCYRLHILRYVWLWFVELQRRDRCRTADSPARQNHHLRQSPQEQHHRPGVPGEAMSCLHPNKLIYSYCSNVWPRCPQCQPVNARYTFRIHIYVVSKPLAQTLWNTLSCSICLHVLFL